MLRTLLASILALAVSTAGAQIVNRPVGAGAIANPGTSLPSTCAVGYVYFKSNSTAGQNLHLCTAANTWTQMTGGNLANPVTPGQGGSGVANSKNLTWSNSLTLAGTDATTMTFPTTSATIARTDASNTFTGDQTLSNNIIVSGVGPRVFGGATLSNVQERHTGSFTGSSDAIGIYVDPNLTPTAGNTAVGLQISAVTMNKAGSGTHADFATVVFGPPTIVAGAAALTNSSTVKISGAPSVGTNLRALWVAGGITELNGPLTLSTGATANQIRTAQSTVPTCTTNCGSGSPTVAGTDTAGIITLGTTPASAFQVNFNGTWASAPSCIVQSALATMVVGKMPIAVVTTTTTMIVTTNGTAPATSDKYQYHCIGVS